MLYVPICFDRKTGAHLSSASAPRRMRKKYRPRPSRRKRSDGAPPVADARCGNDWMMDYLLLYVCVDLIKWRDEITS